MEAVLSAIKTDGIAVARVPLNFELEMELETHLVNSIYSYLLDYMLKFRSKTIPVLASWKPVDYIVTSVYATLYPHKSQL
jgi:hypothetical protein